MTATVDLSSPAAVADFLDRYNAWRRAGLNDCDEDEPAAMPDPSVIGLAIDTAIALLRAWPEGAIQYTAAVRVVTFDEQDKPQ